MGSMMSAIAKQGEKIEKLQKELEITAEAIRYYETEIRDIDKENCELKRKLEKIKEIIDKTSSSFGGLDDVLLLIEDIKEIVKDKGEFL